MKRQALFFILALTVFYSTSGAHDKVLIVEEDWEMQVGEPNTDGSAPQATIVMSPTAGLLCDYFILTLNHKTLPEYEPGGLQVQVWSGDNSLSYRNGPQGQCLDQDGDTLRWTQRMRVNSGELSFEVTSGTSQTWGSFGGQGYLKDSKPSGLQDLNYYRRQTSLDESGVGFAGNRVDTLKLLRTRWYVDNGQVYELPGNVDVDADLDPWTSSEAVSSSWEVSDL